MGSKSFAIGEPDYAFDLQEVSLIVGRMWLGAKPATLLLNAWNDLIERRYNEHRYEIALTRLTSNSDTEALARDAEFLVWLKPHLEWHEGFIALNRRLAAIGILGEYSGFGEYVGQSQHYMFRVRAEHLPLLEALAQEDAGFVTPEARAAAARDFRIYMKRHYHEDWENNRRILPPVDVSPYAQPPFNQPRRF
jgi:hypothetical protein